LLGLNLRDATEGIATPIVRAVAAHWIDVCLTIATGAIGQALLEVSGML
jgi:hypothetical protein